MGMVKVGMVSRLLAWPRAHVARVKVTMDLTTVYHAPTATFTLLDRANVSLLLQPPEGACGLHTSLVILVLSSLDHRERRRRGREEAQGWGKVLQVFLLAEATSQEVQEEVEKEQVEHGDLLQVGDPESYTRLVYKTLAGLLWAAASCPHVTFVAKTDDDVTLDLGELLGQLEGREGELASFSTSLEGERLACPSVSRNFRPNRSRRPGSMLAKWRLGEEEWREDRLPHYCPGWLWVTTPRSVSVSVSVSDLQTQGGPGPG